MRKAGVSGRRTVWLGLIGTPVVLVAVIAALGVGVSAAGQSTSSANPVVVSHRNTGTAAATIAYWTPERMRAAKPPTKTLSPTAGKAVIAGDSATGAPGLAGGMLPGGAPMPTPATPGVATTSTGVLPADGGYPGPYTGFKWYPRYRTYPVSTISKIFATQDIDGDGMAEDIVCSGAVTATPGGNLDTVWTEGYCVNNGLNGAGANDGWSYNVLVCPSYVNGINPAVGCWAGVGDWASTDLTQDGSWSRDLGAFTTAEAGSVIDDHIAAAVGGLGFAWNRARDQHWMVFGYPESPTPPFDGGAINTCATEHRYDVAPFSGDDGPAFNSVGCNAFAGGGPWILGLSQYGGYINSVDSMVKGFAELGKETQGPYFDTEACDLWKAATGWTGTCS